MDPKVEQFRNGIFSLRTNFGELSELMIREYYHYDDAADKTYDLHDPNLPGKEGRIEVKFARAYKNPSSIKLDNVLTLCSDTALDIYTSDEWEDSNLFCNIEQIKPELFSTLFYGIFWKDKIEIFCIDRHKHHIFPTTIKRFKSNKKYQKKVRESIPYLYLQHNQKDYQFHLKKNSIPKHRKDYAKISLTYEELYSLFSSKK